VHAHTYMIIYMHTYVRKIEEFMSYVHVVLTVYILSFSRCTGVHTLTQKHNDETQFTLKRK